ncbi:hypothetical protein ACFOQM_19895 [Paenibacillus sp. GCM10012307]|uniref:Uncharacterized protein n=1 Tax=Paenibacillus roseus TaxID=2798579 RepID=A0A934MSQ3_9BACL|nr:hypothetical protein [Paenibacillus roseus]MBJ6363489.1 hypothetical protein [Paenibacillus roseus]
MEKRLTRTEMMFSLGFLLMLIVAVAAFFFGVKIGSDKIEAQYLPMKHLNAEGGPKVTAYQQQDLVSYYHTVFLPLREFQTEWFSAIEKLENGRSTDASASFKELAKQAKKQYQTITTATIPAVSPLLADSQVNVLKSLKLFEQAANRLAGASKDQSISAVLDILHTDAYYAQAVEYTLQSQQQYYGAMLKWGATVNVKVPSDYETPSVLELSNWNKLPFLVKNKVMADQLSSRNTLEAFYPHDLSVRVDEFIESGQPAKMRIKTVSAVVDLLLGTKAVRKGDFTATKLTRYDKELLPQLPFFYMDAS